MTQEDIIRMAREADIDWHRHWNDDESNRLEAFAALVAAAENEACAKQVDHILKEGGGTWGEAIRARGQA